MKKVIKEIREGSVTYGIDDKGVLKKMHNDLPNEGVMIPRVLPSGDVITAIGARFIQGEAFDKIDISDEITWVKANAFKYANVRAVRWSAGCKKIPDNCFEESTIETLTGIEKVRDIEDGAFMFSHLSSIVWPKHCTVIPKNCFKGCILSISNIEKVLYICDGAFEKARFTGPADFSHIPLAEGDSFKDADTSKIVLPREYIPLAGSLNFI